MRVGEKYSNGHYVITILKFRYHNESQVLILIEARDPFSSYSRFYPEQQWREYSFIKSELKNNYARVSAPTSNRQSP